ncbi:response regulator [Paenibacillus peoriae]|uniref:response regulator n=1 Tax=Paenibacillus peoriae TaxID=59893 RepID=UPI00026C5B43|nr:response regulator [Paenibacillus peoriae]MEC0184659.1 response regulator [Paenibacillus peoriae]
MYSVMIVDDELFVRKGLIEMIDWESSGFKVIDESDNGEDALAIIQAKKPDLVVTDIRMPVLDGLELIEAVSKLQLETEFVIISGYNDFRYAQQAVRFNVQDYVLKPIDPDDIQKALAKLRDKLSAKQRLRDQNRRQMGEKLIETLLWDEIGETVLDEWGQVSFFADAKAFTYILLEVNNVVPWKKAVSPARDQLMEAIRETVQELGAAASPPIVYEHRRTYGFIVPDTYLTLFGGDIHPFMRSALRRLKDAFALDLRIYAGKSVESLNRLRFSYNSAKETMQHKWIRYNTHALLYSDIADAELNYLHLHEPSIRTLIEAVEASDMNGIRSAIHHIFVDFLERNFSIEAIKTSIMQCVLGIAYSVRSVEGDEKELGLIEPILVWYDYNLTLEGLRGLFSEFASEAAELVKKLYNSGGKSGIHKIKSYVDQHFHQNLSLKSLAAQFFMNSAYIGQLFKKHYGVYFNDYLLQLRIEEAKKLMRQKDIRIYEIAERVGFNSAEYFVSQFEKVEKMTPTEYRNRMSNQ